MPHFILDCSKHIIELKTPKELMQAIFDTANATDLFAESDIKVRINPFTHYTIGNMQDDFIHVFGHIVYGRSDEQKAHLSRKIVSTLKAMFPEVPVLSVSIKEFDTSTYVKKSMV